MGGMALPPTSSAGPTASGSLRLPLYHLPGTPAEAGFAHGRALRDSLFMPAFVEAYLERLALSNRFTRGDLARQSVRWLATLPSHFQEEIAAMGEGAGVGTAAAAEFLYADIARPTESDPAAPSAAPLLASASGEDLDPQTRTIVMGADEISASTREGEPSPRPEFEACRGTPPPWNPALEDPPIESSIGPMCSAIIARLRDRTTWIGRNCDWLTPTLMRGVAAVLHEAPHRIPVLAVGIRGDIDVDTGINAERLWLHLHTLPAVDSPPAHRSTISWLFWAREALEQCASLDELERFIASTGRDRGVLAIAGDGKTNEAAIFECSRAGHLRHDFDPGGPPALATNHPPGKVIDDDRAARARSGGTIGRHCAMRRCLTRRPAENGPTDLMRVLADPDVEMRTPTWMRTIYSAVVRPADASLWFAAGRPDGAPAASTGKWAPAPVPASWRSRRG